MSSHDGNTDDRPTMPRAVIHKQILDEAQSRPDASVEELAAGVTGVSTDLVAKVLDEYGDPAADDGLQDATDSTDSETTTVDPPATEVEVAMDGDQSAEDGAGGDEPTSVTDLPNDDGSTKETGDQITDETGVESAGEDGNGPSTEDGDVEQGGQSGIDEDSRADESAASEEPQYDEPNVPERRAETEHELAESGVRDARNVDPALEELTDRQREILAVIAERPDATQGDVADHVGVSQATVSNHLRSIEGFDWDHRQAFVDAAFDEPLGDGAATATLAARADGIGKDETADVADDGADLADRIDAVERQLDERLAHFEARLERLESRLDTARPVEPLAVADPELKSKVVHACVTADALTREEELRIVRTVVGATGSSE